MMAIHDSLKSAVNAAQAATEAIRQAAEDAKREDANQPVPLGGGNGISSNGAANGR